jgi:hypothetical protein
VKPYTQREKNCKLNNAIVYRSIKVHSKQSVVGESTRQVLNKYNMTEGLEDRQSHKLTYRLQTNIGVSINCIS